MPYGVSVFRKFIIFAILCIFVRSLSTLSVTLLLIHFTFPRLNKRILISHLSCLRWRTLISSLFMAFVSSLHRFRDCLRLPAPAFLLAWVKMNFPLYYLLFPLHGYSCRFLSVCLLLCNAHLFLFASVYPSLFSRILFPVRYVSALLQGSCCTTFFRIILRVFSISFSRVDFSISAEPVSFSSSPFSNSYIFHKKNLINWELRVKNK